MIVFFGLIGAVAFAFALLLWLRERERLEAPMSAVAKRA
jgi:hypothetical protein